MPALERFRGGGAVGPRHTIPASPPATLRNVAATAYTRLHERFLRLAGGEAQSAQEAVLTMLLRPGLRMLDAGCGPGMVARRLLAREPGLDRPAACLRHPLATNRALPRSATHGHRIG